MHKHLRITFLLMISAFLFAGPVDIGEAKHLAKNFFPEKTPDSFRAISDQLFLSTFEGGGFLLISRDDAFPPVLGYSRTAPADSMHPAFEAHCSDYSLQISRYASASCEAHPDWDHYRNARFRKPASQEISPLISSRWNQSPYYNDLFPYLTLPGYTDRQAYAGCVAVVMGQLMRYYRHPVRGFGRRSYFSYSTDSTLSAWFDTTYYDWDNMPDSLSVLSAADEVAEVSRLLYQSAISVEMDLQPDGSSSTYEDMMYALISYFDYATGMTLRNKDSSSDTEWKTMIRSELDDGNPVPYRGQGDAGGHAYLLDGYRVTGDTYFHFNWGWGGQYDGWFLLSALAPAEGYDFTERQAAVLGIRKNTGDTVRLAYSGFEHWLEGWIYSAEKFFLENGSYDMVHSGNIAYGFDGAGQWLITPKIRIPDNDQVTLSVWAKMLNSSRQCRVLLSQGDTLRSSFVHELGTIAPHNEDWAEYHFSLRNYRDSDVHIAFSYDQSSGYIVVDDLTVSMPRSAVSVGRELPREYALLDVYPNPFNREATIRYTLEMPADVHLNIYNLRGEKIHTLAEHAGKPGSYSVRWDASGLPSGIYLCDLKLNGQARLTRKILLLK